MKGSPHLVSAAALIASCVTSPRHAFAQTLRGSVVDSATARPVQDFTAMLLDASGNIVQATIVGAGGVFTLGAPGPGEYRVRLLRIGYRSTLTAPFHLDSGAVVERRFLVRTVPTNLAAVRVTGQQSCVVRPAEGAATAAVWDEVEKALIAMRLTQDQALLRFTVHDFVHDLARDSATVLADSGEERSGVSRSPYVTPSPRDLADRGYVQEQDGTLWFYAPDANVLMSDDFLATHCLRLKKPAGSDTNLIALGFAPARRRTQTDIRGTMWVDKRSATLRFLEFSYVPPPSVTNGRELGGRVEFLALPGGTWLVRRWMVGAPLIRTVERRRVVPLSGGGAGNGAPGRVETEMVREMIGTRIVGGEITAVYSPAAVPLWSTSVGSLGGVVRDSANGAPLAATVRLLGTARETVTDSLGRFRFDTVPAGDYTIIARPVTDSSVTLERKRPLSVTDGRRTEIALAIPLSSLEARRRDARCESARAENRRRIDSLLKMPAARWHPSGADSATTVDAIARARIVMQVLVDTTGSADLDASRPLRARVASDSIFARRDLKQRQFPVYEPIPGCKLPQTVIVPFLLRPTASP